MKTPKEDKPMDQTSLEGLLYVLLGDLYTLKIENMAYKAVTAGNQTLRDQVSELVGGLQFDSFRAAFQAKKQQVVESARRMDIPELFGLLGELAALPNQ
jgi:hypothetical protein